MLKLAGARRPGWTAFTVMLKGELLPAAFDTVTGWTPAATFDGTSERIILEVPVETSEFFVGECRKRTAPNDIPVTEKGGEADHEWKQRTGMEFDRIGRSLLA